MSLASLPVDSPDTPEARQGNRHLMVALLATLLLWNVPYGWYALYPFKVFATWLHEFSHGFLMLVTGAGFERMEIFQDTSGLAYPAGGVARIAQAVISSAGYMGTSFFGGVLLALGRTPRGARAVLSGLAALMLTSVALWVRNGFGILAVGAGGLVLLGTALRGTDSIAGLVANFLAAQSCINAVLDIRVLFGSTMFVNGQPHGVSDAHTVARMLGGPPWVWATLWLLWSFALFYAVLRWARVRTGMPAAVTVSPEAAT